MTTHYYTASSLDGFIATLDHSLDWLFQAEIDEDGPMAYPSFISRIGAMAMGASTYEWLLEHEKEWLPELPVWVFSHRDLPRLPGGDITITQGDVSRVHDQMMAAAAGRDIWIVGGGDIAGQFADAGLLDEMWVQFAPVTLGSGQPLLPRRLEFELIGADQNHDFVCTRYRVSTGSTES